MYRLHLSTSIRVEKEINPFGGKLNSNEMKITHKNQVLINQIYYPNNLKHARNI